MALTRSIVRASVIAAPLPAEGIAQANRLICADAANGMFVTLCYAQLDPETGEVVYVNAGHNPPLLMRAATGEIVELPRTGMVLGFDAAFTFDQRTARLNPGDFALFYTDGLTEAINEQGEEFGLKRLRRVLLDQRGATAEEIVEALERAHGEFVGDTTPFDDVTLVIAKRL
jgi:sigma-B regulation protein RsbU (phosphoserine phosphatase)